MKAAGLICLVFLGTTLITDVNSFPFLWDDSPEQFWTKADFEDARENRANLEAVEDTSSTRSSVVELEGVETDPSEPIFPRIFIKTNYKDSEGNIMPSQNLHPSELSEAERENVALNFFSKYGYYEGNDMVEKTEIVKRMQENHGLPITGELDDETMNIMVSPRCGNPDRPANYNFFPGNPFWRKTTVTYKFVGYSPDLSPCLTRNILRRALHYWAEVVELNFVEVTGSQFAMMEIFFGFGAHGDPWKFDGVGKLLAHAFPPGRYKLAGDTHFDESELWTEGEGSVLDTYFGNSNGARCVFPFTYNGRQYSNCITDGKKSDWCATTSNYDRDGKYGFCPSPNVITYGGNGGGKPCVFPFSYRGQTFKECTTAGRSDGYKWCATTGNYEGDKKFGLCPGKIDPSKGAGRALLIVAAHEFGHAIGMEHSRTRGALMYPTYKFTKNLKLGSDDINGARRLYRGGRKTTVKQPRQEQCSHTNMN